MKRLFHTMMFSFGLAIIEFWPSTVQAQTRPACGCAFAQNRQPRNVVVLFAGESTTKPAQAGMVVHTGDLIKVNRRVSGTLVCDNVQAPVVLTSTPRNKPVPCKDKPPEGILIGRNGRHLDSNTMNDNLDVGYPIILSPRSTKLLNARPVLRWTTVADATSYKVIIRGDEGNWSTIIPAKSGSQTQELVYPQPCASGQKDGCAPPLKAGESYKLVVEANGRSSEEEDLPNLGFTLLTGDEIRQIQNTVAGFNRLALGNSLKIKMLASLYANNGLNAEAIRILEDVRLSQRNPEALRLLGNLYLNLSLTRRAEALYLNLLKLDLLAQDTPAGKAITHQTLGEIYEALGNKQQAVRFYIEAKNIFRNLGDRESASKIKSRLANLGRP